MGQVTKREFHRRSKNVTPFSLSLSFSNGATARGGPRPSSRVSSILPGLGRLFSNFYTLALLHLPPIHLPNAAWVSLWGAFLLAHWGGLSWINHRHPGIWHVLPISVYSACRISQCHSHHTVGRMWLHFTYYKWFEKWGIPPHILVILEDGVVSILHTIKGQIVELFATHNSFRLKVTVHFYKSGAM